mgnify:CR=1 FL=1
MLDKVINSFMTVARLNDDVLEKCRTLPRQGSVDRVDEVPFKEKKE